MGNKKYPDVHIGDIYTMWEVIDFAEPHRSKGGKTTKMVLCRCRCNKHTERLVSENALKRGESTSCGCERKRITKRYHYEHPFRIKSFYEWCVENEKMKYISLWDYDKNKISPKDVSYTTHTKYYFKCSRGIHESELHAISSLIKTNNESFCCKCNSFAQKIIDKYGDDALEIYWNYEMNEKSPWDIPKSSKTIVYLNCKNISYHKGYGSSAYNALKSEDSCSFCSGNILHQKDSFGQWLIDTYGDSGLETYWDYEKNTKSPFEIPKSNTEKIWIKCDSKSYHGSYQTCSNKVYSGRGCPYCSPSGNLLHKLDSLGTIHNEVFEYWSDKNKENPYEISPSCNRKFWFKCPNGIHDDYKRKLNDTIKYNYHCPSCSRERTESFLQENVRTYIESKYPELTLLHENNCTLSPRNPKTNMLLRYDNEIKEIKLIIEVHGKQHYSITGFHKLKAKHYNISLEEAFQDDVEKDSYKMNYAIEHGYSYIAIPYYCNDDESYKEIIDNKINEIVSEKVA